MRKKLSLTEFNLLCGSLRESSLNWLLFQMVSHHLFIVIYLSLMEVVHSSQQFLSVDYCTPCRHII